MYFKILLNIILGYVSIEVEGYFIERFINLCQQKKIFLWNLHRTKTTIMKVNISIRDFKRIREIAKKTKTSEIYVAKKVVELANLGKEGEKDSHIGYYLISKGITKLYESLGIKKTEYSKRLKSKINLYINGIFIISVILSFLIGVSLYNLTGSIFLGILEGLIIFIPITEIVIKITQSVLGKIVKTTLLPKMDLSKGIDKENQTMVVIPTILEDAKKVEELSKKLEVYYLANKSENIYFTILGDCTSGDKEILEEDKRIIDKRYRKDRILK